MTRDVPRRLVVLEANEVPRRVLAEHIRREPSSALAHLVGIGQLCETEVTERLDRELYPSQTWYSMNSGVPHEQHGVYWYGDPKPEAFPLYWQVAAGAGRRVGLVNTLHSSPMREQCSEGEYAYVIPDCFAEDADTEPVRYRRFQELNLRLTRASGRNSHLDLGPGDLLAGVSLPALGVRPATMARLAKLGGDVALGRVNKERLRIAQSMILADMFLHLGRRHDPDLAVLFTNHVASAMHRYWFALYPDDWDAAHYPSDWVERYRGEVPAAMRALDDMAAALWRWCERTDRILVLCASMGQAGSPGLDTSDRGAAVVRDPERFARALGVEAAFEVGSAMVPQIHYDFSNDTTAATTAETIRQLEPDPERIRVDQNQATLTVTYHLGDLSDGVLRLGGVGVPLDECGVVWESIDDHRSGIHDPHGVFLVAGAGAPRLPPVIDALDVAPLMLDVLGVEPTPVMRSPSVRS